MTGDDDLTELVARLLCAETGDLRQLALLAGGDPRTFYVGTSMDGVDVRGQDLRGMALPGLDRARARVDEQTIFDPLPESPETERHELTLIYFATDALWRAARPLFPDWPGIQAYSPRRREEFLRHCDYGEATKLVVVDGDGLSPRRLSDVDRWDVITIVYRPWQMADPEDDRTSLSTAGSVVLLPHDRGVVGLERGAQPTKLPAVLRDAIELFVFSRAARRWMEEQRSAAFYRTSRTAGRPVSSAWDEMASLLVTVAASAADGMAFCAKDAWDGADPMMVVAKECAIIEQARAGAPNSFVLGLLTPPKTLDGVEVERRYEETVEAVALGRVPLMKGQMAGPSSIDFTAPLFLGLRRGWWTARHSGLERSAQELIDIDLPAQGCILAAEPANLMQVLTRLGSDRRLTASVRDIAFALQLPTPSSWNVVGAQALRFAASSDDVSRQIYFTMLVHQALRARPDHLISQRLKLLQKHAWELGVRRRRSSPELASFKLNFHARDDISVPLKHIPLVLTIDSRGCHIASRQDIRA